jgi:hypothetical protein
MTARRHDRSAVRGTTLQDELLEDLRLAAPVPIPPPEVTPPEVERPVASPEPAVVRETPTIEIRLTPLRWSRPRMKVGPRSPLTIGAGPVQISVTGLRR